MREKHEQQDECDEHGDSLFDRRWEWKHAQNEKNQVADHHENNQPDQKAD